MLNYSLRVHSLLIPIENENLLLPNENVAEVVQFKQPDVMKGAPEWFLGFMPWREMRVPLIGFEVLLGQPKPSMKGIKWVIVMNALGGKTDLPFFCVLVQGKPKLIQVDDSIVTPNAEKQHKAVLSYVHVHGDPALIPDPDYIESMIRSIKHTNK